MLCERLFGQHPDNGPGFKKRFQNNASLVYFVQTNTDLRNFAKLPLSALRRLRFLL